SGRERHGLRNQYRARQYERRRPVRATAAPGETRHEAVHRRPTFDGPGRPGPPHKGRRPPRPAPAVSAAGPALGRAAAHEAGGPPTPPLSDIGPGPYVALRGVVVRTEPQPGGMYGVAVKFTHHRFL